MNRSKNRPSATLQVSEDIVPIGDFKSHLSENIRVLRERRRPLIVTQNGRAAAVLLAPEEFDRLTRQAQFVAAVHEGLDDLESGRVLSNDALGRRLDERFRPPRQKK
jgi:prevent-host-death family protein